MYPLPVTKAMDEVDAILEQWSRERPEIDVSAMAIVGRISRLEKLIAPRLDSAFSRHGLESWEFDVLATLRRHAPPHQLTPGALIVASMITSGAMTNRIDRLEQRGFVKRSKSPRDGRQILVTLTKPGVRKIDAALIDHAANEIEIVSVLNERQKQQLIRLLRILHTALEARSPGVGSDDRGLEHS